MPRIALATILFVATISVAASSIVVRFPDVGLEAAIREAIGKPTGSIYDYHLDELRVLDASNRGIVQLEGIQYCLSLVELDLRDNDIVDISALSGLTRLTSLALSDNQIVDLTPLSDLFRLTILRLGGNLISELGPLTGLIHSTDSVPTILEELELERNEIADVHALAGFVALKKLRLDYNEIVDITALSALTNLASLNLTENRIVDVGTLSSLIRLKILVLDGNLIADISPLSGLTDLFGLWLNANLVADIRPLVDNLGLDFGDRVYLCGNPLDSGTSSRGAQDIDALTQRGVYIYECSNE